MQQTTKNKQLSINIFYTKNYVDVTFKLQNKFRKNFAIIAADGMILFPG